MFSPITHENINPFAYLPSSSSSSTHYPPLLLPPSTPLFINHENPNDNILLYNHHGPHHHHRHHQDPLLVNPFWPPSTTSNNGHQNLPLNEAMITMPKQQDVDRPTDGDYLGLGSSSSFNIVPSIQRRPVVVKIKDRHSKIYTAQGLRDRRVRLSIEIAREFFDLQDMLGFDKASKTLEWLLAKSRKAIKEVSKMKHKSINGGSLELEEEEEEEEEEDLEGIVGKSSSQPLMTVGVSKEKNKLKKLQRAAFQPLGKESGAKAKEKARTRTKKKTLSTDNSNYTHPQASTAAAAAATTEVIEKSILIKRNYISNNNNNNWVANLPPNSDINGAIPRSTFCAITNMELSTGTIFNGNKTLFH